MKQLITKEEISKNFTFHYDDEKNGCDLFFCRCGSVITTDRKTTATEMKISVRNGQDISDITNLFDENALTRIAVSCKDCKTDYSLKENYGLIQETNKQFFESYFFEETDTYIKIIKQRFLGAVSFKEKRSMLVVSSEGEPFLEVQEAISYIKFNKADKKLFFKDFTTEEQEFNLDKVMSNSKKFFLNGESKITDRLFEVHLFLNRIANFVSDSRNINIIDELMSQMVGKSGLDIITKVASIFLGIICYSNLSTIALTKGTVFLFDMMNDCTLPNPQELSDNEATSPIKIFNYLVNYKNEEISKELDSYDQQKTGYAFITKSGKEINLNYKASRFDKEKQTSSNKTGDIFLREDITKKSVSPYIFNSIQNFADYKTIIKYTKFVSYDNVIDIVKKHNINLLIYLFSSIEFRADMNYKKLNQIIHLATSYLERRRKIQTHKHVSDLKFTRDKFAIKEIESSEVQSEIEIPLDYYSLVNFDFTSYDDSLRMIRSLTWDPDKEFYKIKKIDELELYHNKLTEHFNLLSNDNKNKDFVSFVKKYTILEEYEGKLAVKLIKTPELLLKYANDMKNCAGSYVNRVSNGQYVLCMVSDIDEERTKIDPELYMLGLTANKYGELEFDQIKAACNVQGSDRFKKNVMDFLQEKEIPYRELADLRLSTSRGTSAEFINNLANDDLINLLRNNPRLNQI